MEDIKVFDPIVQVAIVVVGLVLCVGYWLYIQTFFNKSKIKWNKIVYSIFYFISL
jgi:hypothetical protein